MSSTDGQAYYITIVFPEDTQALFEREMHKAGLVWAEFVAVTVPDYFQFPYQIQYQFRRRDVIGDENYRDWSKGDIFIDEDEPGGPEHVALRVSHEYEQVYFPDPEHPGEEVLARFDSVRRIRKRGA